MNYRSIYSVDQKGEEHLTFFDQATRLRIREIEESDAYNWTNKMKKGFKSEKEKKEYVKKVKMAITLSKNEDELKKVLVETKTGKVLANADIKCLCDEDCTSEVTIYVAKDIHDENTKRRIITAIRNLCLYANMCDQLFLVNVTNEQDKKQLI
jgi:intergrase/recombinase